MVRSKVGCVLVLLSAACRGPSAKSDEGPRDVGTITPTEFARAMATVRRDGQIASGFLVARGYVITTAAVASTRGQDVSVEFDAGRVRERAVVERLDSVYKLALLRCSTEASECWSSEPVTLGSIATLELGDPVQTLIINPGMSASLIRGFATQPAQMIRRVLFIETNFDNRPFSHGSPLFDEAGRVVGVMTEKPLNNSSSGFAVPIDSLRSGDRCLLEAVVETLPRWAPEIIAIRSRAQEVAAEYPPEPPTPSPHHAAPAPVVASPNISVREYTRAFGRQYGMTTAPIDRLQITVLARTDEEALSAEYGLVSSNERLFDPRNATESPLPRPEAMSTLRRAGSPSTYILSFRVDGQRLWAAEYIRVRKGSEYSEVARVKE